MIGRDVALGGQAGLADHCEIQDGAVIGAQAGILPGKIIRSGQIVWGNPGAAARANSRHNMAGWGACPGWRNASGSSKNGDDLGKPERPRTAEI